MGSQFVSERDEPKPRQELRFLQSAAVILLLTAAAKAVSEKFVCIPVRLASDTGVHPAEIQNAVRIETFLDFLRQLEHRRRKRFEHIDPVAHLR